MRVRRWVARALLVAALAAAGMACDTGEGPTITDPGMQPTETSPAPTLS